MLMQWTMSIPHPLCGWEHPGGLSQTKCISHCKPASCILDGFWFWQQMLQICGASFILGFTFANSAVFLSLTLLHTPNKYADCLFPLSVSPQAHKNRRMPEYCPVPFPTGFSRWHNTMVGTTDWASFSATCYHDLLCACFHTGCFLVFFFFLHAKRTAGKGIFFLRVGESYQYCIIYLHFQ